MYYFSNDVLKTKYNYEYAIYRKLKNACGYINSNTKVLYRKVNDWQELSQYDINHI